MRELNVALGVLLFGADSQQLARKAGREHDRCCNALRRGIHHRGNNGFSGHDC